MPRTARTPPKPAEVVDMHVQSEPATQKVPSDAPDDSPIPHRQQKRQRIFSPPSTETVNSPSNELLETIRHEIKTAVTTEISASLKTCVASELSDLKEALELIKKLEVSVQFMSTKFDQMKSELDSCKDTNTQIHKENELLKKSMMDLSTRVNLLEQNSRQRNVEVNGVPENKSENLVKTVMQLGRAVSSTLKEAEIVSAVRVRKLDPQNSNPRTVIVKLNSTISRDELLTSVMNFNKEHPEEKLNSSLLGYGSSKKPVFVSEHLSPLNKEIHAATRKAARDKGYKYVWVRDGRILIRKADGMPAKQVRSLEAVALL